MDASPFKMCVDVTEDACPFKVCVDVSGCQSLWTVWVDVMVDASPFNLCVRMWIPRTPCSYLCSLTVTMVCNLRERLIWREELLTEFASLFGVHDQSQLMRVCNCECYSCQWGGDSEVGTAWDWKARRSTDAGLSPQCNDSKQTLSKTIQVLAFPWAL